MAEYYEPIPQQTPAPNKAREATPDIVYTGDNVIDLEQYRQQIRLGKLAEYNTLLHKIATDDSPREMIESSTGHYTPPLPTNSTDKARILADYDRLVELAEELYPREPTYAETPITHARKKAELTPDDVDNLRIATELSIKGIHDREMAEKIKSNPNFW